jgi:hypothetical protein
MKKRKLAAPYIVTIDTLNSCCDGRFFPDNLDTSHGLIEVLFQNLTVGTEKSPRTSVRISDVLANIHIESFPTLNQGHSCSTSLSENYCL